MDSTGNVLPFLSLWLGLGFTSVHKIEHYSEIVYCNIKIKLVILLQIAKK